MQVQNVSIDSIKPYENNPRDNDGAVGGVAESIKQFGWQQPIVVDKDSVIIVGHTRYKAAKQLHMKEVPIVVAKNLSDEQVKAYRLADNKTGEKAIWDNKELLKELNSFDSDDLFTGFKTSDIFQDVLNESDNTPIEQNKKGVTYSLKFRTQNKATYEQVKHFIEEVSAVEQ